MTISAAITGWGMAVPERVVTNEELVRMTQAIDEEWIVRRAGIRERRYARPGVETSTLAAEAGREALRRAGIAAEDLDLIVVATCTPDQPIPGSAPLVQAALGASRAGAFDVNAACAGFLIACTSADALIRAGRIERALVVGAEVLSRFLDHREPKTSVLFGDGAGAVVLERSERDAGFDSVVFGASGEHSSLIELPAGGSARPATATTVAEGLHAIRMDGPEVYRAAVRIMTSAAMMAISRAGMDLGTVDLLIAHQANDRIIREVGDRLGLPRQRVFSNVASYGNTSAASVPIAITDAADRGLLQPGSRFVVTVVGAGLTWAAATGTWTGAGAAGSREIDLTEVHA